MTHFHFRGIKHRLCNEHNSLVVFFYDNFSYKTYFPPRAKVLTQFKIQDLVYCIPPPREWSLLFVI
jgi:hypothetical protein